jgi:acetyltransferase-like isoleucine patch superfamily enzyme
MSSHSRSALRPADTPGISHAPNVRDVLKQASELDSYRQLTYPTGSLLKFFLFELATMILLPMPGGLGLLLRRKLLKRFFGSMGRNVIIGRNCVFRHPHKIFIGDSVAIDDNCLLDARGAGDNELRICDGVILSRGVQVKTKGGGVYIGRHVSIGDDTKICSHAGLWIGDGAAIAGECIISGGTFSMTEFNVPAHQRISTTAGPLRIGAGTWIANGAMVLDGVEIGENSILSAGSVATRSLPDRCLAHGNPAVKVFDIR